MDLIEPKAIGRLLAEKPTSAEGITKARGRIWCPNRSISCRTVGGIFMFTFHHASGMRKAIDDGTLMFDNDLLVIEDFDENKFVEYEFLDFQFGYVC
jgi:hypothetical protein